MKVTQQTALKNRNSLSLPARCQRLIEIENRSDFNDLPALIKANEPVHILGGGSNTVLTQSHLPHTVITQTPPETAEQGITLEGELVLVDAGAPWPEMVHWAVNHGLGGIENLAAIPGSCGAAPIQNIGAYGVELKDVLEWVEIFDWRLGRFFTVNNAQCQFGYRNSYFKRHPEKPWIITRLAMRLRSDSPLRLHYSGVRETLIHLGHQPETASYAQVAQAITTLRAQKLPNPAILPNAGSFFKNPVISDAHYAALKHNFPALPHWPQEHGGHKISAAWLIQRLGLQNIRVGDAGFYRKHALIVVNYGQASGADVLALARYVITRVQKATDITLEVEPVCLPETI